MISMMLKMNREIKVVLWTMSIVCIDVAVVVSLGFVI